MWNALKRYGRLAPARRRLVLEALATLALARLATACLPFRYVAAWLGTPGTESAADATAQQIQIAQEISWAVQAVARRVPWDGRCLAQALAATAMLRRRRMEGTVSFGARRGVSTSFEAHAWVRMGPCIVTGGPLHEQYNLITTFARSRV